MNNNMFNRKQASNTCNQPGSVSNDWLNLQRSIYYDFKVLNSQKFDYDPGWQLKPTSTTVAPQMSWKLPRSLFPGTSGSNSSFTSPSLDAAKVSEAPTIVVEGEDETTSLVDVDELDVAYYRSNRTASSHGTLIGRKKRMSSVLNYLKSLKDEGVITTKQLTPIMIRSLKLNKELPRSFKQRVLSALENGDNSVLAKIYTVEMQIKDNH